MGKWRARGALAGRGRGWVGLLSGFMGDLRESSDMTTYCKNPRVCRPSLFPADSQTKMIKQELSLRPLHSGLETSTSGVGAAFSCGCLLSFDSSILGEVNTWLCPSAGSLNGAGSNSCKYHLSSSSVHGLCWDFGLGLQNLL